MYPHFLPLQETFSAIIKLQRADKSFVMSLALLDHIHNPQEASPCNNIQADYLFLQCYMPQVKSQTFLPHSSYYGPESNLDIVV